jgi:hypothetical protein
VSLNNGAANKLDAYLQTNVSYSLGECGQTTLFGLQGRKAKLELNFTNAAPAGLPTYVAAKNPIFVGVKNKTGTNRTLVSIYAPVGSTTDGFTIDGNPAFASETIDRKHVVWTFDILLRRGQSQSLVLNWVEPIANADNESIQTPAKLIAPLTFLPVQTKVASQDTCPVQQQ